MSPLWTQEICRAPLVLASFKKKPSAYSCLYVASLLYLCSCLTFISLCILLIWFTWNRSILPCYYSVYIQYQGPSLHTHRLHLNAYGTRVSLQNDFLSLSLSLPQFPVKRENAPAAMHVPLFTLCLQFALHILWPRPRRYAGLRDKSHTQKGREREKDSCGGSGGGGGEDMERGEGCGGVGAGLGD